MKQRIVIFALAGILWVAHSSASAQAPTIQAQPTTELFIKYESEEYKKREASLSANSDLSAHVFVTFLARFLEKYKDKTEAEAEGRRNGLIIFFWSKMPICTSNVFWKDGKPQEATVKSYLERIGLVPLETRTEWDVALAKVTGSELRFPIGLGAVMVQDRLFDANAFKQAESKKLLTRMSSIPKEAIKKWAEVRQLDDYQAAISLVNIDPLFSKEVFQPELFAGRVQEMQKK